MLLPPLRLDAGSAPAHVGRFVSNRGSLALGLTHASRLTPRRVQSCELLARIRHAVFTGIVEEVGRLSAITRSADGRSARIVVDAPLVSEGALLGDSIAINGTCLT